MFTAPAGSTLSARQFGEVLATELGRVAGVQPPTADQRARLQVLTRAGLLPARVLAAFEDLCRLPGGGSDRIEESVATHLVERCFELAVWFFRLRTSDHEPLTFVHTDAPELRNLAERTDPLEPAMSRLRREFDLRALPAPMPASKRERLIVGAHDAALEPLEGSAIALEVERRLVGAGWVVLGTHQNEDMNRSHGCAVPNPRLTDGRRVDYLLLVGGQVVGLIECQRNGADLGAAMEQADTLARAATDASPWPVWRSPLPYRYVSDGQRLLFRDENDPEARTRLVSGFHQPATLARWRREAEADGEAPTYQARLATRLPYLAEDSPSAGPLHPPQLSAVRAIEQALQAGQRRALVQMATGTGKTVTGVFTAYRQLKYAKANRILFVTDRTELAHQVLAQFHQFNAPDDGRAFTDLYNVEELTSAGPAPSTRVVVTATQQLANLLRGMPGLKDESDRVSAYETAEQVTQSNIAPLEVTYSAVLPPDSFDLVVVNECHQWIYGAGRGILEYFDAPILGLTATPVAPVFGFFNGNLISEYPYEQAIADGLVVDYSVYQARMESPQRAVLVPLDEHTALEDKRPRRDWYEQLDEDFTHAGPSSAPRTVRSKALAAVLTAYRDSLPTLFPGRATRGGSVPKTVVFALSDLHADEVVDSVHAVFGASPVFCQKITLRCDDPDQLLRDFRTTPEFRIAVVVDLISGSTDMRAVECVLLLRAVRSTAYYEQLLGRGAQRIAPAELRAVTPGASAKTQFVVIDAAGATRNHRRQLVNVTDAAGSAGRVALAGLLHRTVEDSLSPDETAELGLRLARLIPLLTEADDAAVRTLAGVSLQKLVGQLLAAVDADHLASVHAAGGKTAVSTIAREASAPLSQLPALREALLRIYDRSTGSGSEAPGLRAPTVETVYSRLAAFKERHGKRFNPAQLWWIENIAESAAAGRRFDPADLDGVPFSGRGGTDGFLHVFGADRAIGLLDELNRELA
ncbi:DEAD/DEAH box helicase family protein [Kitasatospora sp. McL0602]|uniref:DEAD/DEAH box helicase family protein n=1 Tax=Kitasatospora sp. McL0602 TaxID=3439530 RepID=UPI003F88ED5B